MKLHELKPARRSRHRRKRVGRGAGSGLGKTAGRGEKGQLSRAGGKVPTWFEGGQMPLSRRLPKRGFTNIFRTSYVIVNLHDLEMFEAGSEVTPAVLVERGLVRRSPVRVKVLGDGELSKPLRVTAHRFSSAARAKILAAGGAAEAIDE